MYSRIEYSKIYQSKDQPEITVLLGPRQVGKTTLIKALQEELGGLYFDLDILSNYERVKSYEDFLQTLKLNGYREEQQEKFYIFLDEFQRYADLTMVFKNIYDHHPNVKIFATGSSSFTIKNQIQESLAGRKKIFHLYPLNFEEFLIFKERDDLLEQLRNLRTITQTSKMNTEIELYTLLEEFMIWGGYPGVVLAPSTEEKKEKLQSIFDAFIKKDLVDYLKIEKFLAAKRLIESIAINNGQIANYNNFAQYADINAVTVKNYIELLRETFIIMELRPFFRNKNKEVSKAPKLYFLDNGARNFFINNFNPLHLRQDASFLFEGYFISEFYKTCLEWDQIKY
ncbi:MAG: ATP-binding protein [Candidatus Melainabacteria bacterium]|nr:ATP-binding protein [Candidatus Melainabacteria bacterium]